MNEEAQQDKQGPRGLGMPISQDTACRPPARQVLIEHIIYLQEEQKNLQILHDMLLPIPLQHKMKHVIKCSSDFVTSINGRFQ